MSKIIDQFRTIQLAKITGFTVRQLDYWARTKLLVPSIKKSDGSGTRKLYSFDDLVRLHFIKQLHDVGWSTQKIRMAMAHLDEFMKEQPTYRNFRLIPDKNTILVVCATEKKQQILLDVLNPSGQQVMWIILEMLRKEAKQNTLQILDLSDDSEQQKSKII